MDEKQQAIVKTLADVGEALRPGDIAAATGIEKAEVSKLMKKLKAAGLVHSPKVCFWAAGSGEQG